MTRDLRATIEPYEYVPRDYFTSVLISRVITHHTKSLSHTFNKHYIIWYIQESLPLSRVHLIAKSYHGQVSRDMFSSVKWLIERQVVFHRTKPTGHAVNKHYITTYIHSCWFSPRCCFAMVKIPFPLCRREWCCLWSLIFLSRQLLAEVRAVFFAPHTSLSLL